MEGAPRPRTWIRISRERGPTTRGNFFLPLLHHDRHSHPAPDYWRWSCRDDRAVRLEGPLRSAISHAGGERRPLLALRGYCLGLSLSHALSGRASAFLTYG